MQCTHIAPIYIFKNNPIFKTNEASPASLHLGRGMKRGLQGEPCAASLVCFSSEMWPRTNIRASISPFYLEYRSAALSPLPLACSSNCFVFTNEEVLLKNHSGILRADEDGSSSVSSPFVCSVSWLVSVSWYIKACPLQLCADSQAVAELTL